MCSHYTRLSGVMLTRLTLHQKTSGSILDWVNKKFFLFGSTVSISEPLACKASVLPIELYPRSCSKHFILTLQSSCTFYKTFQNDFTQHALLRMRQKFCPTCLSLTLQPPIQIPMMLIWNNNYYPSMTRILMNTLFDIRIYTLSDLGNSSNLTG